MGRRITFTDGNSFPTVEQIEILYHDSRIRPSFVAGNSAFAGYAGSAGNNTRMLRGGGVHRFGGVSGMLLNDVRVLDASIDWRDRIVSVYHFAGGRANLPDIGSAIGQSEDWRIVASAPGAFGTGPGTANGSAYKWTKLNDCELYAGTDGALRVRSLATPGSRSHYFLIAASERLGIWGAIQAGDKTPLPAVSNLDPIPPQLLNDLQDRSIFSQFRGGLGAGSSWIDTDAMPFGPACVGSPPVAASSGRTRQPVAGGTRIWYSASFSVNGLAGTAVLDDSIDWRDRLVSVTGIYSQSSTVIPPGQAVGTGYSEIGGYTGHGWTPSALPWTAPGVDDEKRYFRLRANGTPTPAFPEMRAWADTETGALKCAVDTAQSEGFTIVTPLYVFGVIVASPQLGPRSRRV